MKLPEFVTADFTRKTIALAMAVIIWVVVRQQLQAKATFQNIPVVFTAAPDLALLDHAEYPMSLPRRSKSPHTSSRSATPAMRSCCDPDISNFRRASIWSISSRQS
jgi:hypothetical protein